MNRIPLNEHFFDVESKAMWYVLGVSFSRYSPSTIDNRNSWRSSSYDLLKIIQVCLETSRPISYPNERGSRLFQIRSSYIQEKLIERGLVVDREERMFPAKIEERYLDHFVRGFFDAHVSCCNSDSHNAGENHSAHHQKKLQIYFNLPFLIRLYDVLVAHAHVGSGREVTKSPLIFSGADVRSIHGFIYRDWDYIQKSGLFLPLEKAKFEVN